MNKYFMLKWYPTVKIVHIHEITVHLFYYDEVKGQEHNQEQKNEISPLKLQNTDSLFSVSEQVFFGFVSFWTHHRSSYETKSYPITRSSLPISYYSITVSVFPDVNDELNKLNDIYIKNMKSSYYSSFKHNITTLKV